MTVVDVEVEFFEGHGQQVHDVADVQVEILRCPSAGEAL